MTSIDTNQCFDFGDSWSQFLNVPDNVRIEKARSAMGAEATGPGCHEMVFRKTVQE